MLFFTQEQLMFIYNLSQSNCICYRYRMVERVDLFAYTNSKSYWYLYIQKKQTKEPSRNQQRFPSST